MIGYGIWNMQRIQELEKQLEEKGEEVDLLERKVGLLQGGAIEGMVSRAQVSDLSSSSIYE
jgi:predicted RNase H-like nuclease (RuvC/YqgF family)